MRPFESVIHDTKVCDIDRSKMVGRAGMTRAGNETDMKGWFRLWVVVSLIAVPAFAIWQVHEWELVWEHLNANTVRVCVDAETTLASHPDALQCAHNMGADKTAFAQEHTTPAAVWSEALGFGLLFDLVLTGMLAAAFAAFRWVSRGFRNSN
jgi:hypothetical protein